MKQDKMIFNLKHKGAYENRWFNCEEENIDFVFYPKESHMHGFGNEPPKDYKGIYKVYYSWAIEKRIGNHPADTEIGMRCDECSEIIHLSNAIRHCLKQKKDYKLYSFGQEGSIWELHYCPIKEDDLLQRKDSIQFSVWSNYTAKGYRFYLDIEEAENFAEFIDSVNKHMLENGEPI